LSTNPISAVAPTRVIVVESDACHFCDDAHRVLEELAVRYPLAIDTVSVRTAAGQELMSSHRAALSPLVLLDGTFFSHGRLPRRKLTKVLHARYGDPARRTAEGALSHG
jgi:hypothetical protein